MIIALPAQSFALHGPRGTYSRETFNLYYWRTRAGVEVDFIVYGETGFWAIEVKNAAVVRSEDLRSLRAFVTDYPECEPVLVYRGAEQLVIDGIRCVPAHEFLVGMRVGRGLGERG